MGGADQIITNKHDYPENVWVQSVKDFETGTIYATHFANITSNSENNIKVIRRIKVKDGVYINDISDWGRNLGRKRHSNEKKAIQVQEEVLMNAGSLRQTGNPIPSHKIIDGMKAYYVDFIQL